MSANPQARSIAVLVVTWILTVPLLVFASQYGFSFEHGNMNTLAGSASLGLQSAASFDNIFLRVQNIGVYAICLICLWPFAQVIVGDLLLRNPLLTLLPTLCFVSSVWSQQPGHTLVASAYLTIDVCFVAYLLRRFTTDEVMQLFVLVGSIAALASLFLIVVLPQFGIENRRTDVVSGAWQGIFPQKISWAPR